MKADLNSKNPKSRNFAILLEVDIPVANLQDDYIGDSDENRQTTRCVIESFANSNLKRNVTVATDRAAMAPNTEYILNLKQREKGNAGKKDAEKSFDKLILNIGNISQKYRRGQLGSCYSDIKTALEITFAEAGEKFPPYLTDGYMPLGIPIYKIINKDVAKSVKIR